MLYYLFLIILTINFFYYSYNYFKKLHRINKIKNKFKIKKSKKQ